MRNKKTPLYLSVISLTTMTLTISYSIYLSDFRNKSTSFLDILEISVSAANLNFIDDFITEFGNETDQENSGYKPPIQ